MAFEIDDKVVFVNKGLDWIDNGSVGVVEEISDLERCFVKFSTGNCTGRSILCSNINLKYSNSDDNLFEDWICDMNLDLTPKESSYMKIAFWTGHLLGRKNADRN